MTGPTDTGGKRHRSVDRNLVRYVRRTVYPYSDHYRRVLDASAAGDRFGADDLARIPPTDLSEIEDPARLVLRPQVARVLREGDRRLAARTAVAKLTGGMHRYNRRVLERRFKPVHWILDQGVPIGYSSADLLRLARLGQAWLDRAGVREGDVVLSVLPAGPSVAYWQLVLGCRRAGVSAIHLDPTTADEVGARLAPTVLVGLTQHLLTCLARMREDALGPPQLRTILAIGDPLSSETRGRLRELSGGASVVAAWSPPGVRAVWSECRAGSDRAVPTGYHSWDHDVLELGARPGEISGASVASPVPAELLWTGVGWRGSALVRLRTFALVTLEGGACPGCGRGETRVVPVAPVRRPDEELASPEGLAAVPALTVPVPAGPMAAGTPAGGVPSPGSRFEAILDADRDVAAWQIEFRTVAGCRETIVFLAPAWGAAAVPLIRRIDRHLRATQFIIEEADEVARRVLASEGRRIIGDDARE
ncbi:MAG: hypothetical protein NVS3B12_08630 [Acidimicrobiales bacterium]